MWAHLRTALIVLHLVAVTALALPAPRGLSAKQPDVRRVLSVFAEVSGEPEATWTTRADSVFGALDTARQTWLKPFFRYARLTGASQGWQMFAAIRHRPARLEIHLDAGAGFTPLYIRGDRRYTWRSHQLDQKRFRSLVNDFSYRSGKKRYRAFVDWLTRQAAADFSDGQRLQVQLRMRPLPPPAQLRAEGSLQHTKAFWIETRDLR